MSWGPAFSKEGDVGREIFAVVVVSFLFTFVSALVLRYLLVFFSGIHLIVLSEWPIYYITINSWLSNVHRY